jgi:hypothetical protein
MPRNVQLEHLVLAPFRETAGKARTALDNAESAEEHDGDVARAMQRAARGLLSKAERALKKIEPLCERFTGEYGPAFVDAVKDNGKLAAVFLIRSISSLAQPGVADGGNRRYCEAQKTA